MTTHPTVSKLRGPAIVVMVNKFLDLEPELIQDWLLGNALRDTLRLRAYASSVYLTDGERIWDWGGFPGNKHSHTDWEAFLDLHDNDWDLFEPTQAASLRKIPPGAPEELEIFKHVKV